MGKIIISFNPFQFTVIKPKIRIAALGFNNIFRTWLF